MALALSTDGLDDVPGGVDRATAYARLGIPNGGVRREVGSELDGPASSRGPRGGQNALPRTVAVSTQTR